MLLKRFQLSSHETASTFLISFRKFTNTDEAPHDCTCMHYIMTNSGKLYVGKCGTWEAYSCMLCLMDSWANEWRFYKCFSRCLVKLYAIFEFSRLCNIHVLIDSPFNPWLVVVVTP